MEPTGDQLRRRAKAVFIEAIEAPEGERAELVDRACGGDAALLTDVKALLRAHGQSVGTDGAAASPSALDLSGTRIGRYRLRQRLGEGGFGEVYLAEQDEPVRRQVALKVVKPGMDSRGIIARFEQERQALAMMDHPHIARVLDAGQTETGRPYFVMEVVRGVPITEFCATHGLRVAERLGLMITVCRAVQHAHQKGVIHRDLKPSNVLVSSVEGRPVAKVIDFGIAKATGSRLTDKTLFTDFRVLLGTPEYMSPEQADPKGEDVDTRSDVYSLGVLLYELLTGATPFDRARLRALSIGEIQRVIREEEPPKPSTRLQRLSATPEAVRAAGDRHQEARQVRGDLDWIAMKALEKDRARRYESAGALAADLERHLRDEPVLARPPGTVYRWRKTVWRHRVAFGAGAAVVAALVVGLGASVYGLVKAGRERDERESARAAEAQQRGIAERSAAEAQRRAYRASIAAAQAALQLGDAVTAGRHLEEAPTAQRRWEWDYLRRQMDRSERRLDLAADGFRLFMLSGDHAVLRGDDVAEVRNWVTGRRVMLEGTPRQVPRAFQVSPRGDRVMVTWYRLATLHDARTGRLIKAFEPGLRTSGQAFSPDGRLMIAGGLAPVRLEVLDAETGERVHTIPDATDTAVRGAFPAWSPDGTRVAAECDNTETAVLDARDWRVLFRVPGGFPRFTPDGRLMVIEQAARSPRLAVHAGSDGALLATLTPPDPSLDPAGGWGHVFAWSPDGEVLAVTGPEGAVHMHDGATLAPLQLLCGGPARPEGASAGGVAFSSDGRLLASLSRDLTLRVWDAAIGAEPFQAAGLSDMLATAVALSPDGRRAASGDWGRVAQYDGVTGAVLWARFPSLEFVRALAYSPDGQRIAVAGERGTVRVLAAGDGAVLAWATPVGYQSFGAGALHALAWTPDRQTVLVGTARGSIVGLAANGLATRFERSVGDQPVEVIACSARGATALIAGGKAQVLEGPTLERAVTVAASGAHRAAWSASGDLLVVSGEGFATVFDAAGEQVMSLAEPTGRLAAVAISRDQTRVIGASARGGFALWSLESGDPVAMLPWVWAGGVGALTFSPDGRSLVAAGGDAAVLRYDASPVDSSVLAAREVSRRARSQVERARAAAVYAEAAAARLLAEPGVSEVIRAEALRINEVVGNHAGALTNGAIMLAAKVNTAEATRRAVAETELAMARCDDPSIRVVRGVALVRAGRFEEALAALDEAEAGARRLRPEFKPTAVYEAFRCLALAGMGRTGEARSALERLEAMGVPGDDEYESGWLAEARTAVGGAAR